MQFPSLLIATVSLMLWVPLAGAASTVSSGALQQSANILFPSGENLEALNHYSSFTLQEAGTVSGGIRALYEARLTQDPWLEEELPQLQIVAYAYGDQATAHDAFDSARALSSFSSGQKRVLNEDDRWLYFEANSGNAVDIFGTVNAEYYSYHLLHVNGNVLYQASIYREDEGLEIDNAQLFTAAVSDTDHVYSILHESIDTMSLGLSILFPPTESDLSAKSRKSSLNLSELYSIPRHGTISFDIYINEASEALGTVLDSSGISAPEEGDFYVYVNQDGRLFAGIYAPDYDADCEQSSGWYRIETSEALHSYEWNAVDVHFGVGGFSLDVDGEEAAYCGVAQPRADHDLFFGDYPHDSIQESVIAFVNDLEVSASTTLDGRLWDDVLSEQLFIDLSVSDLDNDVFLYLKEAGIFTGSDGYLYPDQILNRAEMVKILLRTFGKQAQDTTVASPFIDVPSDAWYLKYLVKARDIGMIEGYADGSFQPSGSINRAEFFTMLVRLAGERKLSYQNSFVDVDSEDWYALAAAFAAREDLLDGNFFGPAVSLSRREAARILYRFLND